LKAKNPCPLEVIETSEVTDLNLGKILNQGSKQSWRLESILLAMRASNRCPDMAFLLFVGAAEIENQ